ncbi:MAG: sigma-54-dependent Fis family transcriptional regulator [Phycisphaerae bacterium]|nr:sigma-54-dependent Fis family transcriptional regulator [Phycisphaerae bacterium]
MIPTASDRLIRQVLIIDPDPRTAQVLLEILARRGARGTVAATDTHVRDLLSRPSWNLIFLALELDRITESAATILARIRSEFPERPVIMLSGTDSARSAIAALRGGCTEFLVKPLQPNTVEAILDAHLPRCDLSVLSYGDSAGTGQWAIVGIGAALRRTVELARKVAPSTLPVLIQGESGTGKELLARWIHSESRRAANPFIRINCAALNDALLESELFGHEKGAFTGAVALHKGRFERAHGGTLLLDEITETSPAFQSKLLRVLEEMDFERVGGKENISVNVRILSTTNADILARIAEGRFRQDLYYRLAGLRLHILPLRHRPEDIPQLIWLFVHQFAPETGRRIVSVDADTLELLARYPWPGNVRQLRNTIRSLMILGTGEVLTLDDVPSVREELVGNGFQAGSPSVGNSSSLNSADLTLDQLEQTAILAALDRTSGNQTRAARALGISNRTLREKIKRYRQQGCLQSTE